MDREDLTIIIVSVFLITIAIGPMIYYVIQETVLS